MKRYSYLRERSLPLNDSGFSTGLWVLLLCLSVLVSILSAHPFLVGGSLVVLAVIVALLRQPGAPPILLFAACYQWLQVTSKMWLQFGSAVDSGMPLGVTFHDSYAPEYVDNAIALSLVGLVVLSLGMWWRVRYLDRPFLEAAFEEVEIISMVRLFGLYLASFGYALLAPAITTFVPPAATIILASTQIKWVFFFLFSMCVIQRQERWGLFAFAFALEVAMGLGYFAGFTTVLFVFVVAYFTTRTFIDWQKAVGAILLVIVFLTAGAVWSQVKNSYRTYLNQGTGTQTVRVSKVDQLERLAELSTQLTATDLIVGVEQTFERLAYVDIFAAAIEYVPDQRSHAGGKLWGDAISHVVKPRIFFPDKEDLGSDTDRTMEYTGLRFAGEEEGTSVSMGYMAESYIDFGPYGMFVPIFLLGIAWGSMYAFFVQTARLRIVAFAFATAVLINAHRYEVTSTKLLGGILMTFIVMALIIKFVMPYITPLILRDRHHISSRANN